MLNAMLLDSVPLGVTTWTLPLVAPAGTLVVISEGRTIENEAATPLNLTLVTPTRFEPRILTVAPTAPELGKVFTNGPRLREKRKTEPEEPVPPIHVVP